MFGRRVQPKLLVTGIGATVATHAWMTGRQLDRFDRTLALFCPACRKAHNFDREHLRLTYENPTPPL